MYESYYGFVEKPFSLTPDPKFLFRSPSHAGAFELLQYAIRRREGFVVITGDIGTGKTTLCRALLEEIDRSTYTALVLIRFCPKRICSSGSSRTSAWWRETRSSEARSAAPPSRNSSTP